MKNTNYITIVEKTNERHHRSHIILHKNWQFYLAEFNDIEQLNFFADMLGFAYTLMEEKRTPDYGTYRQYEMSHQINEPLGYGGFWERSQIPAEARPFKATCNGSTVTCYFTNDGKTINIYRPNPNAKEVYKPLELSERIAHRKIYGSY